MHDTLIKDVKLHVDTIEKKDQEINISGWCGSSSIDIDDVRLKCDDGDYLSIIFGKKRDDVRDFYKNEKFLNSGFEITAPKKIENSKKAKIQILKDSKWQTVIEVQISKKTDFKISQNYTPNFLDVDDFYENPDEVRDFALSCNFNPHPEFHKGQRTEEKFIPDGIKERFEKLLHCEITSWEDQGANGVFQYCTAEDQLVYHVDTQTYAAVVYLTPDAPASCGTTFFKSGRTGLRGAPTKKDCERLGKSEEDLSFDIFKNNFYDKTDLEVVDVLGNVYNRLVIWDAKLIHAASEYFGNDKENSRLFHMFFFDVK